MAEGEQTEELHRVLLPRVDLNEKITNKQQRQRNKQKPATDLVEKGAVVEVERGVGQRVRAEVDAAARLKETDNDEREDGGREAVKKLDKEH